MKPTRPLLAASALLLLSSTGLAQGKAAATLWSRTDGDVVRAAIEIEIDEGWHLYHTDLGNPEAVGKPTVLTMGGPGIEWAEPRFPEPETLIQEGMAEDGGDGWILGHHDVIVVYAIGRRGPGAGEPTAEIAGLTCLDDGACIPYRESLANDGEGPDTVFLDFPEDLEAPGAAAAAPAATGPAEWVEGSLGHVRFRLYARAAGGVVRAVVEVEVDDGWHMSHTDIGPPDAPSMPLKAAFGPADVAWSAPVLPEPDVNDHPELGTWSYGHHGALAIRAAGAYAAGAGEPAVTARLKGATCEDRGSCIPFDVELVAAGPGPDAAFADFPELAVGEPPADAGALVAGGAGDPGAGAGAGAGATPSGGSRAIPEFRYAPRESGGLGSVSGDSHLLQWMFFAFLAGMILNVMPCVLPVVSIKVLSFVNQAGESRGRVFALGLAFALGILSVFLVLGVLAATAGLAWGEQFQSTEFLVVMIGIVFGLALSLFGLYEIGVPQAVGEMAGHEQQREGLLGAFTMGILSTLLATPCSGPFLGSTLAWAVTQEKTVVVSIFAMAGVGMAAPYAVLTSNPAFLKYVPKPGAWMETFKHAMGFLLLFTVLFLMASVPDEKLLSTVTFLVFVGLSCWIWGRYARFDQTRARHVATGAWAALAVAGGAWLSFVGLPRFFAPSEIWEDFDLAKLERYHEEGRNVFLDFTADWCATCKTNEKVVYEAEEVEKLLRDKSVVAMKVDLTDGKPDLELKAALRDALGSTSIPFAAVFPGDDPYRPWTMRDLVTREQFTQLLHALP